MEAGDDRRGYRRGGWEIFVRRGGTGGGSRKSICDGNRRAEDYRAASGGAETKPAKRNRGGEQRGGHEPGGFVLRRDLLAARVPSLDEAGGVRCGAGAVAEAGRAAGDH